MLHIAAVSADVRPCTQVVQHFTELGLGVTKARISSDGGWFVDVFEVQEAAGGPVLSEAKLSSIKRVSFGRCDGLTTCDWQPFSVSYGSCVIRPRR